MGKAGVWISFFVFFLNSFVYSKNPAPPLEKITEFRQQHRKTLDGRLCAAAFLHNDQTYTDCTDAVSPDGTSGREWCYVEVQLLGKNARDWDYCTGAINYNKLRIHAKRVFEEKSLEADRLKDRLNVLNNRVHSMLQKYDSVCGKKHELVNSRIEKINEWLAKSAESLDKIEEHSNNIKSTKETIDKLQIDIKNETSSAKHAAENCEESPGYENEPVSDGLKVSYFANPFFEGLPVETGRVKNLTFFHNNRGPVDNVSPFKYGIRFEGFLLAPHSGTFVFVVQTDCAVRIFLDNHLILTHAFEEVEDEKNVDEEVPAGVGGWTGSDLWQVGNRHSWKNKTVRYAKNNDEKSTVVSKNSKPVELIGGEKHAFVVEVSHSSHLKFKSGETASFKLLWKSSRIDEQVIKEEYLFTENVTPPTRVSALNPDIFEIGLLDVDEQVFKNNPDWVVSQVPPKYVGLHLIRTEENPHFNEFTLQINTSSNLFIAAAVDDVLPLGPHKDSVWKAFETNDFIEVKNKSSGKKKKWKVNFIPFKNGGTLHFKVLTSKTPFVLFSQQRKILPTVCSGEEQVLSTPGNNVFKECTESSALTNEFNCLAALNNLHMDKKFSTWRTVDNAIGEYIHVFFNDPVQINKFRFKPRDDILTWPSEIALTFDDTQIIVPILHTSNMFTNTHKFEHPVITTSVKIEIKDLFIHNNETGGSFELLGNVCNIETGDFGSSSQSVIDVIECGTTINSIPDILPLVNGDKFLIRCDLHCLEGAEGEVFGSDIYASESSVCKTAIHAGVCQAKPNKDCKFLVSIHNKRENFVGILQNNILSKNLNKSENLSFSVSSVFTKNFNRFFTSKPNSYSIVFKGTNDLAVPNKFLIDPGEVFQDFGGFAYGWNKPIKSLDQFHPSVEFHSNVLFSGGITFPPASATEHCISDVDCESNFWKFRTHENGTFAVQVLVGNTHSNEKKKKFLEVNGLPLIKNVELKKHEYFVAVKNVQVTDRTLLFTSTCLEQEFDCSHAQTTILAVQIVKV